MTRAPIFLVIIFSVVLTYFAIFPVMVFATDPTMPPTPPTIAISAESTDCESIKFLVEIQSHNFTLNNFRIQYRIGTSTVVLEKKTYTLKPPGGTYQTEYHVVISELPPDTDIHYWAVLDYSDGSITTEESVTRTNALPVAHAQPSLVFCEGLTINIDVQPNGNTISAVSLRYRLSDASDWVTVECKKYLDLYVASINGLMPEDVIRYVGVINYLTHQGVRTIETPEADVQTNALPTIMLENSRLGFDQAELTMEIDPNNSSIYSSWFEYKLSDTRSDWVPLNGIQQSDHVFIAQVPDLNPGQIIYYRAGLSYMTGGVITSKVVQTDTFEIKTFSVLTGDCIGQTDPVWKTVNYTFNGIFNYTKYQAADQTHFDLGFVWSTFATPSLNSQTNKISLGKVDLALGVSDAAYSFSKLVTGLELGTKYYYRAYVVGTDGRAFYGEVHSCWTPSPSPEPTIGPTVTSNPTSSQTSQQATSASTANPTETTRGTSSQTSQQATSASTADPSEVITGASSQTSQQQLSSDPATSGTAQTEPIAEEIDGRTDGVPSAQQIILLVIVIIAACGAGIAIGFILKKGKPG
ncbi:MAG: hypothetical protein M0P55_07520 [Clostridiales bacterium]|nr:hypothetical protein [Clostridiales bacterium]